MYTDPFGLSPIGKLLARTVKGGIKYVKRKHAEKILSRGDPTQNVTVVGKGSSQKGKQLARKEFGDKTVRHDAHKDHPHPHYQHKNGGRGHVNYVEKLGTIGVATFGDNLLGQAVDFFNPMADVKEAIEIVDMLTGEGGDE